MAGDCGVQVGDKKIKIPEKGKAAEQRKEKGGKKAAQGKPQGGGGGKAGAGDRKRSRKWKLESSEFAAG